MSEYKPPFHMTDQMTSLIAEISEHIGRITVLQEGTISPHLRRKNRIRTIHSSLAIENNSLSLEQVTAILNGKRILGNPNEIREVQNAYDAYEMLLHLDPLSVHDLLKAHAQMIPLRRRRHIQRDIADTHGSAGGICSRYHAQPRCMVSAFGTSSIGEKRDLPLRV